MTSAVQKNTFTSQVCSNGSLDVKDQAPEAQMSEILKIQRNVEIGDPDLSHLIRPATRRNAEATGGLGLEMIESKLHGGN
ncbi:MAG TPA: hypothetical protein VLE96_03465 [Chlamydiales bacterium]|nr:hypothetical protein [Chlamydiales bacterium]